MAGCYDCRRPHRSTSVGDLRLLGRSSVDVDARSAAAGARVQSGHDPCRQSRLGASSARRLSRLLVHLLRVLVEYDEARARHRAFVRRRAVRRGGRHGQLMQFAHRSLVGFAQNNNNFSLHKVQGVQGNCASNTTVLSRDIHSLSSPF